MEFLKTFFFMLFDKVGNSVSANDEPKSEKKPTTQLKARSKGLERRKQDDAFEELSRHHSKRNAKTKSKRM